MTNAGKLQLSRKRGENSVFSQTSAQISQIVCPPTASLPAGGKTDQHYRKLSEKIYFMLEVTAVMEIEGEQRDVKPNDAILIPIGTWHQITATTDIRFLCCCAPVYSHEDTYFE